MGADPKNLARARSMSQGTTADPFRHHDRLLNVRCTYELAISSLRDSLKAIPAPFISGLLPSAHHPRCTRRPRSS